jgi:hypothetical protein
MTLTDQTGPEHALLSQIMNVVAQLDRTAQEHVHAFATMLPHTVEAHNLVNGTSSGSLMGLTVIITIVRPAGLPPIDLVHIAPSNASLEKNSYPIHGPSAGQTVTHHTVVMVPPDHGVMSSLRGTTNISIPMLPLVHGILQNVQLAVSENATRLQNVM